MQEAVSQSSRSQNPKFCVEGVHSLITRDKCLDLQDDYVEKEAIVMFSHDEAYFESTLAEKGDIDIRNT